MMILSTLFVSYTSQSFTALPKVVLDNPTTFMNPFQFEITFECLQELEDGKSTNVVWLLDS